MSKRKNRRRPAAARPQVERIEPDETVEPEDVATDVDATTADEAFPEDEYEYDDEEYDYESVPLAVERAIIEWQVVGDTDEDGERYTPRHLRRNPPAMVITYDGEPLVQVDLTAGGTDRLVSALQRVQRAHRGESDEPPKTVMDRLTAAVDWGMEHKIRGGLLAGLLLTFLYMVVAGFGIVGF